MENELPDEFDLVVIGTGFSESCVAAAASRIGKAVLHIDPNEFYGGSWSSFNLESFQSFLDECRNTENNKRERNASYKWHIPLEEEEKIDSEEHNDKDSNEISSQWSRSKLLNLSRRFNIDLCPKILFSAGKLVELLISSNICRYAEFRAIDRILTMYQNEILNVPCSRNDVFNTKDLSIVEKRLLMKLLTSCVSYGTENNAEDFSSFEGKLFVDYLKANKLTDKIIHCVINAIAMCDENTLLEEGIEKTKKFLVSLGRYGNTPFLFPMYGCGELPQCFCRLCAVFGGIYCLNKSIDDIKVEKNADSDDTSIKITVDGKRISTKHAVLSQANASFLSSKNNEGTNLEQIGSKLSRGIIIGKSPIGNEDLNSGGGGVNLLRLNDSLSSQRNAFLIQLSHYSGTCPKGLYLFHITSEAVSDEPENDLMPFLKQVFADNDVESNFLFSAYFTVEPLANHKVESKIYCTAGPFFELDYDHSIKNAKDIFSQIYPNTEFLPRAPDPEEIILGDEDPKELSLNNLAEDLKEQMKELEKDIINLDMNREQVDENEKANEN